MNAIACPSPPTITLYEQDALSELTGGTLRPGGLALTRELLRCCALPPGAVVLDVGCGPGHTLAMLATEFGLHGAGLDPSAAMLMKAARQAPFAVLHQGTAGAIPCGDGAFDAVISECVLSLTEDLAASLAEMHRVLRPGGSLVLTDIYCREPLRSPGLPELKSCLSRALPLAAIATALNRAEFSLHLFRDRSDLLKQLAGQIIFSHGSLEAFWGLFMDRDTAHRTRCALATAPLGYYALIARKEEQHG